MPIYDEQEKFWAETYGPEYIQKNARFDHQLGADGWRTMLRQVRLTDIRTYLECGCNIGRNIEQLAIAAPGAIPSVIEINKAAFDFVTARHAMKNAHNGPILSSSFPERFDLVFTMGVLIHINPERLLDNMRKIFDYSSRYVLFGEYFNRTPVSIDYQGQPERLFKRDFGKLFLENFDAQLVDYGFLWGHVYDAAGFDDITWWLFEKNPQT